MEGEVMYAKVRATLEFVLEGSVELPEGVDVSDPNDVYQLCDEAIELVPIIEDGKLSGFRLGGPGVGSDSDPVMPKLQYLTVITESHLITDEPWMAANDPR